MPITEEQQRTAAREADGPGEDPIVEFLRANPGKGYHAAELMLEVLDLPSSEQGRFGMLTAVLADLLANQADSQAGAFQRRLNNLVHEGKIDLRPYRGLVYYFAK